MKVRNAAGEVYFEVTMTDAWVWDMYRPARFVKNVRVLTFKDVNVEELDKPDLELPGDEPAAPDVVHSDGPAVRPSTAARAAHAGAAAHAGRVAGRRRCAERGPRCAATDALGALRRAGRGRAT